MSAFGWSADLLWQGLLTGQTSVDAPRRFDVRGQRTRLAAEVPDPPAELGERIPGWSRLSQADRYAVSAAAEAMTMAGVAQGEPGLGVFFGSSTAGMLEGEEYYARMTGVRAGRPLRRLLESQQINGPGDAVARSIGASGSVQTLSSACSSGALAVGAALEALRAGEVDLAVAGGADSLCRLTYSGFNALRAVDERPCRPFRGDRAGLSVGEGAGILVLESSERAQARGCEPLAELLGTGASCDGYHMTAPHPEGEGAARAISSALADARVSPEDVHFVNAHGTGTPLNDVSEWKALHRVFGDRAERLPTTSIKGALGHLLGSAGAIEAVATVQSLVHGLVPPTAGDGAIDDELGVDLVRSEPRAIESFSVAISTSLAFGGANAVLVLGRNASEAV